jgi:hypothetical protein
MRSPSPSSHPEVEALVQRLLQGCEIRRSAADIDVVSVGIDSDRRHLGAELREHIRGERREGAVRAVDPDAEPTQIGAEALDDLRCIALSGPLERLARTTSGSRGIEQRLDRLFLVVGELLAPGIEELDPVVLGRVVRGRDNRSEILDLEGHRGSR